MRQEASVKSLREKGGCSKQPVLTGQRKSENILVLTGVSKGA